MKNKSSNKLFKSEKKNGTVGVTLKIRSFDYGVMASMVVVNTIVEIIQYQNGCNSSDSVALRLRLRLRLRLSGGMVVLVNKCEGEKRLTTDE